MRTHRTARRRPLKDGDTIGATPTHDIIYREGRRVYRPKNDKTPVDPRKKSPGRITLP